MNLAIWSQIFMGLVTLTKNEGVGKGPFRCTSRVPLSASRTGRVKKGLLLHTASQTLILRQPSA